MSEQNFEIADEESLITENEPLLEQTEPRQNDPNPDPTLVQEIPSGSLDIKTDEIDSLQITHSLEEMSAPDMLEEKKVSFFFFYI